VATSSTKNPVVAGFLSGVVPGLGQFYCRRWRKGLAFLIGATVLDGILGVSAGFIDLFTAILSGGPPQDPLVVTLKSLPLVAIAGWSVVDAVKTTREGSAAGSS
jgi:hypothetical protein